MGQNTSQSRVSLISNGALCVFLDGFSKQAVYLTDIDGTTRKNNC